jgi:hypothetical protein
MYYPKSQITTNLHTNGDELMYELTRVEYRGYYYRTSSGKYYSGKTPSSPGSTPLILIDKTGGEKIYKNKILKVPFSEQAKSQTTPTIKAEYKLEKDYMLATNNRYSELNKFAPLNNKIYPTELDYKTGQYTRYFLKKINSPIFKEIQKPLYERYQKLDKTVQYDLYIPFKFIWTITGKSKKEVAKINYDILSLTEQRYRITNLINYFSRKMSEYYRAIGVQENLETDGTEFKNRNTGLPYAGPYHIHPKFGPMVGATHVNTPHDYLDPIISTLTTGSNNNQQTSRGSFGGY